METVISILNDIMWVFICIFVVVAVITISIILRKSDTLTEVFFTKSTIILEGIVITLAYTQVIFEAIWVK